MLKIQQKNPSCPVSGMKRMMYKSTLSKQTIKLETQNTAWPLARIFDLERLLKEILERKKIIHQRPPTQHDVCWIFYWQSKFIYDFHVRQTKQSISVYIKICKKKFLSHLLWLPEAMCKTLNGNLFQ